MAEAIKKYGIKADKSEPPVRLTTGDKNMALVEVKVPDIGDFDEVAVIELLVKVGDTVKAEQSLITVESDKASMEIPSSTAGVVKELQASRWATRSSEGSVVLVVEAAGEGRPCGSSRHLAAAPAAAAPCTAARSSGRGAAPVAQHPRPP